METTTDVQKFEGRALEVPPTQQSGSQALVALAMRTGDLDKLQKAMELQERWEANEARKDYHESMAAFKANPPQIDKDKHVEYGSGTNKTKYSHASLANVCNKVNQALSTHGLSAAWKTTQDNGSITVTCTITHWGGHSESTSLTAAPDTSGSKNPIQAMGSAVSYLQRYTLLALTGLAAADQDDDAVSAAEPEPTEYLDEKQISSITDLLNELNMGEKRVLKYVSTAEKSEITELKDVPASYFQNIVSNIRAAGKK